MKMPAQPCHDCEDRHVGCHGTCEKYNKWHEEFWKYKRMIFKKQHPLIKQYINERMRDQ